MLYAELKNRSKLILRETKTHRYILYVSTKEETDKIVALYSEWKSNNIPQAECDIHELLDLCGSVRDVNFHHVRDVIPVLKTHKIKDTHYKAIPEEIEEYECYQKHKVKDPSNNVIVHEDKVASFRCACELIKTKHFIVLKEPLNDAGVIFFGTGGNIEKGDKSFESLYVVGIDPYQIADSTITKERVIEIFEDLLNSPTENYSENSIPNPLPKFDDHGTNQS